MLWCFIWFLFVFIGLCVDDFANGEDENKKDVKCKMDSYERGKYEYTYLEVGDEYTYDAGKGVKW